MPVLGARARDERDEEGTLQPVVQGGACVSRGHVGSVGYIGA